MYYYRSRWRPPRNSKAKFIYSSLFWNSVNIKYIINTNLIVISIILNLHQHQVSNSRLWGGLLAAGSVRSGNIDVDTPRTQQLIQIRRTFTAINKRTKSTEA
jgi:hypothetical protein